MVDFTKIRWAGIECILITITGNHNPKLPILILDNKDIDRLNKEWLNTRI